MLKAYKAFHKDLLNTKYGKYAELNTYKHGKIKILHIK